MLCIAVSSLLLACGGGGGDGGGASFGSGGTSNPNSSSTVNPPTEAPFGVLLAADNTGFSDTDQYTNKQTLRFTVTIPASGSGLEYTTDFGNNWILVGTTLTPKTQTVTIVFSTDGPKTIRFRATNGTSAQAKGPNSPDVQVTIDTVAPATPTYTTPLGGTGTTTNKQFQWRWTKTSGGIDDMYFDVKLDGVAVAAKSVNEFWQSPTDMTAGGTIHTLTVQAYDISGNPAPSVASSNVTVN